MSKYNDKIKSYHKNKIHFFEKNEFYRLLTVNVYNNINISKNKKLDNKKLDNNFLGNKNDKLLKLQSEGEKIISSFNDVTITVNSRLPRTYFFFKKYGEKLTLIFEKKPTLGIQFKTDSSDTDNMIGYVHKFGNKKMKDNIDLLIYAQQLIYTQDKFILKESAITLKMEGKILVFPVNVTINKVYKNGTILFKISITKKLFTDQGFKFQYDIVDGDVFSDTFNFIFRLYNYI